ncbi:unnamed protein product [Rotaria sordida]|uniref:Uncharacterized protein n=1 Tax=Rotaria sordida TaxID=392033 RepID=A0A815RAS9_9BILA|nr:unnamed protein product [Rotaria sordida]CAF4103306.1 unnamed protein product [Rotaria sordida]
MSRSLADVGWVTRNDGKRDERYRMPQVLNSDGSRDGRYNLFEQPKFSSSENSGVYQIMTSSVCFTLKVYFYIIVSEQFNSGMSVNVNRRLDEHGRCTSDNIVTQMNQAGYRGMDVRARYAAADSRLEARAQELFLLGQRNFAWNSQNNDGAVPYWWRGM